LKGEALQLLILAVPFCAAALLWDKLPARIPIHWNIHGQIDGYAGKTFGALFLPSLNLFITALVAFLPFIDPRMKTYDDETKATLRHPFYLVRLAVTSFFSVVALAIFGVALKLPINVSTVINAGAAILIIVTGNLMTKLRPNYFFGIRTPWT